MSRREPFPDMRGDIVLFTGIQRFCRTLKERGYGIAVLREKGEELSDRAEIDYLIDYDPRDLHALAETVKGLPYRERILTVINRRERRVKELSVLNKALGMIGIGLEEAECLTDKYLMRKRMARHDPSLVPPFQLIEDPGAPPSQLKIGFPLMIKPRNLFKSILVTRCEGPAELKPALRSIAGRLAEAASRHGVEPERGLLAEEFLWGREFSIDSFVSPGGRVYHSPVVELLVAEDIGIDDFHVFARKVPARFASSQVAAIENIAEQGLRALGMINSPAHIDMIYTATGPKIFEVGARVGGYRSEMMKLSFGVDLDEVAFSTSLGKGGDFVSTFEKSTAVLEFFPPREGILKGIEGLQKVRRLGSFHRLRQRTKGGEMVGLARQGYRCPLFVILNHDDPLAVNRDIENARRAIRIEVK